MNAPFNYIVNPQIVVPGQFANGLWTAMLPSAIYDRRLLGINVQGPVGSKALVYLGTVTPANLVDQTLRGQSNTADYSGGSIIVQRSSIITVQWIPQGGTFTGAEIVSATFRVGQA